MNGQKPSMDMNIQKYLAFIKIVECGSFTKAAEKLFCSQSAISRMVGDLEMEWKVTLLERGRSGIKLTSDGVHLLPHIQKVCDEYHSLQMEVDTLNGLDSGLIRIGTFSSVATHWLPSAIQAFQKDYPNIKYELLLGDYGDIEDWLIEGRVDCGFLRLPVKQGLESIFLERDDFIVVLPKRHKLAAYERVPLESLCDEPFLLLKSKEYTDISDIFRHYGLRPSVRCTLWDDYAIMAMVEKGLGISLLPRLILKRIPYELELRELNVPAFRNIGLAMKNKEKTSKAMFAFLNYLPYKQPIASE